MVQRGPGLCKHNGFEVTETGLICLGSPIRNARKSSAIEADKPLPDKFRFLLFEDKREVELVWNGKTSDVTNIVLPFQVIEQVDEPRAEKAGFLV